MEINCMVFWTTCLTLNLKANQLLVGEPVINKKADFTTYWYIIVEIEDIRNLIGRNGVHGSGIFNCSSANIRGMSNAQEQGGK